MRPISSKGRIISAVGVGTPVLVDKTAVPTASAVLVNGVKVAFEAYNIDGYNYFKLRDIAGAVNFGVGYDGVTEKITVSTAKGYTT